MFIEQRPSEDLTRGSRGGPVMPGRIITRSPSGAIKQNFTASATLQRFDAKYALTLIEILREIISIFRVVMHTGATGFRWRDWHDYQGDKDNTALFSLGAGVWQLQRTYTFFSITVYRDILKPIAGVQIFDSGDALLTSTIDTTTGQATVTGTPAYWVGEFDVPVTFMDNSLADIELGGNSETVLAGISSIMLEELDAGSL